MFISFPGIADEQVELDERVSSSINDALLPSQILLGEVPIPRLIYLTRVR